MNAHGWNDRTIAGWLKLSAQGSLTLSECWRIARELSSGPLADVWTAGRAAGCELTCAAGANVVTGNPPCKSDSIVPMPARSTSGAPRLPLR